MKFALIVKETKNKLRGAFMKIDYPGDPYEIPYLIGNSFYEEKEVEQLTNHLHSLNIGNHVESLLMTKILDIDGISLLEACQKKQYLTTGFLFFSTENTNGLQDTI